MATLFISDLHLSSQRPGQLVLFKKLLEGPAKSAEALYILGDLFDDFWIGCDDQHAPNLEVISILNDYSSNSGTHLFIMRGNRDFHLNDEFAKATGCQLIDDPIEITLNNENVLLMHGDTLCTDDVEYQKWRRFITNPFIKCVYAIMPLALRKHIAHGVRGYAAEAVQKKAPEIIDVNNDTVIETMKKFGVLKLIHGHTHRQAIHDLEINGKPAIRIVLGDWYERVSVLIHDKNGFRFERVEDYINSN